MHRKGLVTVRDREKINSPSICKSSKNDGHFANRMCEQRVSFSLMGNT